MRRGSLGLKNFIDRCKRHRRSTGKGELTVVRRRRVWKGVFDESKPGFGGGITM